MTRQVHGLPVMSAIDLSPLEARGSRPPYLLVKDRLTAAMSGGGLAAGDRLPGEIELAAALGVSRMTANHALKELMEEGWVERRRGSGTFVISRRPSGRATILINEDVEFAQADYFFGGLFLEIQGRLHEAGVQARLDRLRAGDPQVEGPLILINPPSQVLYSWMVDGRSLDRTILVGSRVAGWPSASVDCDNLLAGAMAARRLSQSGVRRAAFLGACPEDFHTQQRLAGFRAEAALEGIHLESILLLPDAASFGTEERRAAAEMLADPQVQAVFAAGPHLAMLAVGEAGRSGRKIPQDLSVIACDNPSFLELTVPPLSTVCQPLVQIAQRAADLALQALDGPLPALLHEFVPVFRERSSISPRLPAADDRRPDPSNEGRTESAIP